MRHVQKCNVGSSWPRTVGGTLHRCPLQSNCNSGLGARSKSDPWTDRPEPGHKCKQVMTPSSTTQSYVLFKYIYNFLEWRLSDFDRILLVLLQIFFFVAWEKKKNSLKAPGFTYFTKPCQSPRYWTTTMRSHVVPKRTKPKILPTVETSSDKRSDQENPSCPQQQLVRSFWRRGPDRQRVGLGVEDVLVQAEQLHVVREQKEQVLQCLA